MPQGVREWLQTLTGSTFGRRRWILKLAQRQVIAAEAQAEALQRLADRFAPKPATATPEEIASSGYQERDPHRDQTQGAIQDFCDDIQARLHRAPTEEEIIDWLEDGRVPD